MSKVYYGEEWKREEPVKPYTFNRHQRQMDLDSDRMAGKLTLEQWRRGTDMLSNVDSNGEPFKCP